MVVLPITRDQLDFQTKPADKHLVSQTVNVYNIMKQFG